MSREISVRALSEDEWEDYRSARLAALRESPHAFVASHDEEVALDEASWRERMTRSARFVATRGDDVVGVVSLGRAKRPGAQPADSSDDEYDDMPTLDEIPDTVGEVFGMWVEPESRGSGVATALIQAASRAAARQGDTHVAYWVGSDNGRAVAFASGMGFRPTGVHRPMGVPGPDGEEQDEVAMILALRTDRSHS